MEHRKITLFMVTNEVGKTRKLVIPSGIAKGAVVIVVIFLVALTAAFVDYFGLLAQTAENKRLKAENAQLIKQFQVVEGKVSTLETSLERVKTFATKLKLITNIEGEDRSMKLTMGVNPAANQPVDEMDEPIEDRESMQELEKQDLVYSQPPTSIPESRDELAISGRKDYSYLIVRIEKTIKESQLREESVLDLWETLSDRQSLLSATPNIKPAKGWFTSSFGYRVSPFTGQTAWHAGLDIAAAPGSPVFAPADGVVSFAGYDEGYGKMVTIDHGYGYSTRFGHNSQIYVHLGQKVSRWDVISSVGNTGRSTGPHLHYEVRVNGVPRNPAIFILDE